MPLADRRYPGNFVQIEFISFELFENFPYANRMTLTLVSDGVCKFKLNDMEYEKEAPFILCLTENDCFKFLHEERMSAKSFVFIPTFLNSALTFEALNENGFAAIEDMHDRNLLYMFLDHNNCFKGILPLDGNSVIKMNEWMSIIGMETLSQSDGRWTCRIRRYLLQILYMLEDSYINFSEIQMNQKTPADIALEYLHTNYNLGITLNDVSQYAGMNRTTLNKQFKEKTGLTVIQYLSEYRIKIAKDTLSHTNLKLSEIALCLGYNYDTYFINQFTEKVGVSPTEYRDATRSKKRK